jgi:hypothetical protein
MQPVKVRIPSIEIRDTAENTLVTSIEICQSLGMPRVEVWLGVLLGEFELEQGEEFYSDALWVKEVSVDTELMSPCQSLISARENKMLETHLS